MPPGRQRHAGLWSPRSNGSSVWISAYANIRTTHARRFSRTRREAGTLGDPIARASIRRVTALTYLINTIAVSSVLAVAYYEIILGGPADGPSAMMARSAEIFGTLIPGLIALYYLPNLELLKFSEISSVLNECEHRLAASDA